MASQQEGSVIHIQNPQTAQKYNQKYLTGQIFSSFPLLLIYCILWVLLYLQYIIQFNSRYGLPILRQSVPICSFKNPFNIHMHLKWFIIFFVFFWKLLFKLIHKLHVSISKPVNMIQGSGMICSCCFQDEVTITFGAVKLWYQLEYKF